MLISFSDAQKQRFWAKVRKTDECWLWTASVNFKGYGKFTIADSEWIFAHRASYMMHYGEIGDDLCVLHRCDTPGCIRPDHLFLGTRADNGRDMAKKGRSTIGERNPRAKLTNEMVTEIRKLYATGLHTKNDIAKLYGVCAETIGYIAKGRGWKGTGGDEFIVREKFSARGVRNFHVRHPENTQGENNARARLKNVDIPSIRSFYGSGELSVAQIAERFGVSKNSIWMILSGRTWKNVP